MGEVLKYVRRVVDAATMGTSEYDVVRDQEPLTPPVSEALPPAERERLIDKIARNLPSGGLGSI